MAPPSAMAEFPPGLDKAAWAQKSWPYSPTRSSSLASNTTAQDAFDTTDGSGASVSSTDERREAWSPPPLLAAARGRSQLEKSAPLDSEPWVSNQSPSRKGPRHQVGAWSPNGADFVSPEAGLRRNSGRNSLARSPGFASPGLAGANFGSPQLGKEPQSLAPDVIAVLDAAAAKLPPSRPPPGLEMPPGLESSVDRWQDQPSGARQRYQTPPPALERSRNAMESSPHWNPASQHTSPHCGAAFDLASPCQTQVGHLASSPWRAQQNTSPDAAVWGAPCQARQSPMAGSPNIFSTTPVPAQQSLTPPPPASWGAGPISPVPPPPPTWAALPQPGMWGAGPGSPVPPQPPAWGADGPSSPAAWGTGPLSPALGAWNNGPASPAPLLPPSWAAGPGSPVPLQPAMWSNGPNSPPPPLPQSTSWGAGPGSPQLWATGPGSPVPPPPAWAAEPISPSRPRPGTAGQPLCPPPAAPAPRSLGLHSTDTAWLEEDMSEVIPSHRNKPLKVYIGSIDLESEVPELDPGMPAKKSVPEWF